jgi:hypothetical protein
VCAIQTVEQDGAVDRAVTVILMDYNNKLETDDADSVATSGLDLSGRKQYCCLIIDFCRHETNTT